MIWDAVRALLPSGQAHDVVEHVLSCPPCREAWRVAADITTDAFPAASAEAATEAVQGGRATPWVRWWGLAAAAAVVALSAILVPFLPQRDAGPAVFRADSVEAVQSALRPDEALPRDEFVLRWAAPAGSRFRIRVSTEDLRVLDTAEHLEEASYRVPAKALQGLAPGTRILWQVEAITPAGERLFSRTFVVPMK